MSENKDLQKGIVDAVFEVLDDLNLEDVDGGVNLRKMFEPEQPRYITEIDGLFRLKEQGRITEDEFNTMKQNILESRVKLRETILPEKA